MLQEIHAAIHTYAHTHTHARTHARAMARTGVRKHRLCKYQERFLVAAIVGSFIQTFWR